jgi:monoamine oxidase
MARWQADCAAADPAILTMILSDWFDHRAIPASARAEILSWWTISGATAPELGMVGQLMSPKIAGGFNPKIEELAYTLAGGVQGLAEGAAHASGAELLLSDPAERLTQDHRGVTVRLASGRTLQAKAAIIALPVNALNQIRFDPVLPEVPARIRRLGHVGRVVKYLIRAQGIAPGHLVTGDAAGVRYFWSDHIRADGTTLVIGFALADQLPDPSEAHASAALAMAFPTARFLSADWHDWVADPFSRGVWAGPRAEDEALHEAHHWAPFGRIAFATSDIAPEEQGWFEGALASSEAAVAAVAEMI